ncbi:tail fiber domain-containing protein [Winogradskyella ouciana]|uniref:Peptidase S74 domain-containing protein n=1 Tax=Winogradskyella ouciana TaxID=2608631 RepID=A0A7K1GD43_9FLAO|nr:tail fiber domain-containing protein [Winogradskyella ouciana]MTE26328.1 hypothetical protein [Winogradskyella ouciana]
MKKITSLLVACLFCFTVYAQNNYINYKALVKDDLGNVVANQSIDVRFTIFAGAVQVYEETHSPTTDANGIVILDIGNGTTTDMFSAIDWSASTSLQTEINTGSGYVDLGTTEFKSVPYALNSGNISGLEQITEGGNTGWRLKGKNPENFGNIGNNAIDFSSSTVSGTTYGATGANSFALGTFSIASGNLSTAIGQAATASGYSSTAIGESAFTNANNAIALGSTRAQSYYSTSIGRSNIGGGNQTTWVATDPIFEIGNGDFTTPANALTVLKNGTILANSFSLDLINSPDVAIPSPERMLVTKEYVDAQAGAMSTTANVTSNAPGDVNTDDFVFGSTQLEHSPPPQYEEDIRMFFDKSKGAFRSGRTFNFSNSLPNDGTAWDEVNIGSFSFATGENSMASGNFSFAANGGTLASGDISAAFGLRTKAESFASMAIGIYNIGGGDSTNWIETDPLFEIGNGNSSNSANALTVLKNGNTTINGQTTVNEDTANFSAHAISGIKTHTGDIDAYGVFGKNDVSDFYGFGVYGLGGYVGTSGLVYPTGSSAYFGVFGQVFGTNTSGTNYGVYGNANSGVGATNYAVYAQGDLAYTGTMINASDRKLKTNITTINNSLEDIMRLNPTSYLIRENYQKTMNMSSSPQFGFIAQELQEVFPDLVSRNVNPGATKQDASIEYLGVNYIGLIPVLTKGIQEQQATIETLEEKVERQEQVIASLVARLEALENR